MDDDTTDVVSFTSSQLNDSPTVRAELRGQLQRLKLVEANVQAFSASIEKLHAALGSTVMDASNVGALLSSSEQSQLDFQNVFVQMSDFAENLQQQLTQSLEPLTEYKASIAAAARAARSFDEESEALDSVHHRYLSLSRDSPMETRATAHSDLCDKAAGVALSLFDAKAALRDGCAAQRVVPQRALCEVLVAQLAYHQSCTRLLSSIMPQVSAVMTSTDATTAALAEARQADVAQRAAMPRPQVREGTTLAEGWLYKGSFNLTSDGAGAGLKEQLKPWNKRWFILCDNGKLYYYKSPEDGRQAKVPIDMNLFSTVTADHGPLEFELRAGKRTLRLKAVEQTDKQRWMAALQSYLDAHQAERQAATLANQKRFQPVGTGIRDLDQRAQIHQRTEHEGFLYRQDADLMRRWRKWWCVVSDGEMVCTLFESLRVSDLSMVSKGRPDRGGREHASSSPFETLAETIDPVPSKASSSVSLSLATVSVREARQLNVPYVFEVISPQHTVALQAQSSEELALWMEVIQNATASSLGCVMRTSSSASSGDNPIFAKVRLAGGNGQCADCGAPNPSWASINLGAIVCLACAGVHRQMGVHISKCRSLELDVKEWSEPLIMMMTALGNTTVNAVWQPALVEVPLAGADATAAQREAHLRKKYESRAYLARLPSGEELRPPAYALHLAALRDDVRMVATCLAHRLDVDAVAPTTALGEWTEAMADEHVGRMAVHVAAAAGSTLALELLLQNLSTSAAGIDARDVLGKSAMMVAVEKGQANCVQQLLTRGANISHADHQRQTPMTAAAERGLHAISEAMLQYKLAQDEKLLRQSLDLG